jgi:hypothetical protein
MPKTTIKVSDLIANVNGRNAKSTCHPDMRSGWNDLLEDVLFATDNYSGFGYLTAAQVPAGEKPGIAGEPGNFTHPDETRRIYYTDARLTGRKKSAKIT